MYSADISLVQDLILHRKYQPFYFYIFADCEKTSINLETAVFYSIYNPYCGGNLVA